MEPENVASGTGGMEHNQLTSTRHHLQPRARQVCNFPNNAHLRISQLMPAQPCVASHCRNLRSNTQSERALPANERTQLRWNRNPFLLDSGGAEAEMDPGAWLLPYWMARWIEML